MFSFYPRPQSYYQPSYQASPYARALAQQQQQQRARAAAQETERQRAARSRYFPGGYDGQPDSDDEDSYYLTPRQRALLEARRRQEALEQRKHAAARLAHEHAMMQQAEKERTSPQSPLRRSASPAQRPSPPPRSVSPPPSSSSSSSSPSPSPELLEEAATKIQTKYRIHRSLRAIADLASQFESLKSSFVPPTTIDYQQPAGDGSSTTTIVSVAVHAEPPTSASAESESTAKLAFTATNVALHTYMELLSRLLVALDGVESRGDRGLRERRRSVVRAVEAEAARVEAFWRGVWASHLEKAQQQQRVAEEEEEVCAMVVDEGLPELAAPESESDVEPEMVTPPESPAAAPALVLSPEPAQDEAVVVEMPEELGEEKVPGEDFVLV
ncbi:hypothetical protein C8R46DRAFT_357029 [Mycena filopes]|nr:hypothetical protein C8R46DRAFT_357029 [Mycena filopes]